MGGTQGISGPSQKETPRIRELGQSRRHCIRLPSVLSDLSDSSDPALLTSWRWSAQESMWPEHDLLTVAVE